MVLRRTSFASFWGVIPPRISGQITLLFVIVRPTTLRWRSRTMVSASGSSGISCALQFPPPNIAAEVLTFKIDGLGCSQAALRSLLQRFTETGDAEYASATRLQCAIDHFGAGVEDQYVVRIIHPRWDAYHLSGLRMI